MAGFLVQLFAALPIVFFATIALAQTSGLPVSEQVFDDWRITCVTTSTPPQCQMLQAVAVQEGEAPAFLLTLSGRPEEQAHYGVITVPVGVYLANGIEIFVDKRQPFKVLFEVCDQKGCFAGFKLEGAVLNAFKAGQAARFRVWTAKTQAVEFPVSLKGFTAGWTALQKVVAQ